MKIVSRTEHTPVTGFAARELRRYLLRMLPAEPSELCFTLTAGDEEEDAFSVCVQGGSGEICGSNPRSVLLGVYDYLHHLGCRFPGPVPEAELVPSLEPERLEACYTKKASYHHRGVCIEGADSAENVLQFIDWLPKIGMNSFFLQFKSPYAFLARWYNHLENPCREAEPYTREEARADGLRFEEAIRERGLLLHKVGHGWTGEVLGFETLNWDAAETPIADARLPYTALVNGKRGLWKGSPANTNLCLSRAEAVEAFVERVTAYARENRAVDYLHVWLADEYNNICECEHCVQTTLADQYVELLNEIDRRLSAEGLQTKIVFLLYQELLWPPVRARLEHPERFVLLFAPISRTFERSYELGDKVAAELRPFVRNHIELPTSIGENLASLRGWQKDFQGDGFVYDYPLGRAHYGDFGYVHIARVIAEDIRQLGRMGMRGYISCQELRVCFPNALPNYVMGRLLFDAEAETETIIREYFEAAYGRRAGEVLDWLERLSGLSSCDYINGKGPRVNPEMAARMCELLRSLPEAPHVTSAEEGSLFFRLLRKHVQYVERLARAVLALAKGEEAAASEAWGELRQFLCELETEEQPCFDVYRLLEVTQKYTGFVPPSAQS